ncbi:MAG: PstA family ABC transporter permease [Pirellulaceae bacterium]
MTQPDYLRTSRDRQRRLYDQAFGWICRVVASVSILILATLLVGLIIKGGSWLSWGFLVNGHREDAPGDSGVGPAIIGSLTICLICAFTALPIGIGTALWLEEYQPRKKLYKRFHQLVQVNIANLAGVPSIVYGILGVTAFVYMFGLFGKIQTDRPPEIEFGIDYFYQVKTLAGDFVKIPCTDKSQTQFTIAEPIDFIDANGVSGTLSVVERGKKPADESIWSSTVYAGQKASITSQKKPYYFHFPLHKSVLAAGLTLALVILPIVIVASQESLRAVPQSLREAAFGLGGNHWQVVSGTVLPSAIPGIMTGSILALSRAIGEAAPLLAVMGGILSTTGGLSNLMESTPTLPVTIFRWAQDDNPQFENLAAAAILVLLILLLALNSLAMYVRFRAEKFRR